MEDNIELCIKNLNDILYTLRKDLKLRKDIEKILLQISYCKLDENNKITIFENLVKIYFLINNSIKESHMFNYLSFSEKDEKMLFNCIQCITSVVS